MKHNFIIIERLLCNQYKAYYFLPVRDDDPNKVDVFELDDYQDVKESVVCYTDEQYKASAIINALNYMTINS